MCVELFYRDVFAPQWRASRVDSTFAWLKENISGCKKIFRQSLSLLNFTSLSINASNSIRKFRTLLHAHVLTINVIRIPTYHNNTTRIATTTAMCLIFSLFHLVFINYVQNCTTFYTMVVIVTHSINKNF